MTSEKESLLRQLDEARVYIWGLLADFDPDQVIYPGWKAREFYCHVAGWEAMVFQTLHDYVEGRTPQRYAYKDLDEANADFVGNRQTLRLENAKLECDINRFAIKTILASIPAEKYDDPILFPWGMETLTNFLRGAIEHEQLHAADILKIKQG
jgi:hypothetical protein